jgi:hypothetical protein
MWCGVSDTPLAAAAQHPACQRALVVRRCMQMGAASGWLQQQLARYTPAAEGADVK